jgi:peptidoglycan/xylan/chitin deacetylase (PgdA/CDA1 family)
MVLAHNIGDINHSNYNTRQQIKDCIEPIGFDGIYANVYDNRELLMKKSGIFFVMGDYVGKDNTFDLPNVPQLERYCTWDEIMEMMRLFDFKLGWHTWSHRDLTTLNDSEVIKEITPPFKMDYFAYPYGRFNDRVIELVKDAGYQMAYSVTQGSRDVSDPNHNFKIYRRYL